MKLIEILLAPAVFLLKRLRFPWKFALIGTIAVLTMCFFMAMLAMQMRTALVSTSLERDGLSIYTDASKALMATQDYVGAAFAATGDEKLKPGADTARELADKAMKNVTESVADNPKLGLAKHWQTVDKAWQRYRDPAALQERSTLATAHRELVEAQHLFLRELGDASGLVRDPDPRAAYLADAVLNTLPDIQQQLNEVRNTGILVLGVPGFAREWRRMGTMLDGISSGQEALAQQLARASGKSQGMASDMTDTLKALTGASEKYATLVREKILSGSREMSTEEFAKQSLISVKAYNRIANDGIIDELKSIISWRAFSLSSRFWLMNLFALGIVLVLAYFGVSMYFALQEAVAELIDGTRRAGSGELTHRIPSHTQDELCDVTGQFNSMLESLDSVVQRVAATATRVEEAASGLKVSAAQVAQESSRQSEASSAMSSTMEQVSSGINGIARHAQEAEALATRSGQASAAGEQLSTRTEQEIVRISEAVQQSSVVIDELQQNSHKISVIVTTIKEIAEQTNLLALNAAIEAARAGETGRGFAVVADEVRKLAERTSRATLEITDMIHTIQLGTEQAVSSMHEGVARVGDGVGLTREAGDAMRSIQSASSRLAGLVPEMSLALREQSSTCAEIGRNIEHVTRMAEANTASSRLTLETSQSLYDLAARLSAQIRQINSIGAH
ncbi:methyl-accepting chemotaxis protein [Uliginosibacterium paludis]|uniref:Methyl-accepting chemotaxis protein n=1 Tax=Uliginosibacterium paludis TaxID=1615952 RepID=A0ABV2CSQ9_9RHOO